MTETVLVDPELARQALDGALSADAAAAAEAPPRAPWLNEDGSPKYGLKADGTPRKSPAGPGRPRNDDKARTTDKADEPGGQAPPGGAQQPQAPAAVRDYTTELQDTGMALWMVMSVVPGAGGYAAAWVDSVPDLAAAWNIGAQKNATVRGYVQKFSGEGNWTWVIPVTATSVSAAMSFLAVARNPELRRAAAAENKIQFEAYMTRLMTQLRPQQPGSEASDSPSEDPGTEPLAA